MFEDKKKLFVIIGAAVVAVLAVVAGVLFGLNSHTVPDHKSVSDEKFESLIEGMTAPGGVPPNSMLVVPASYDNWLGMFPYISRISYLSVPYELVHVEDSVPTYFVNFSANGQNDESSAVVGSFKYPVFGVAYGSEREADDAKVRVQSAADGGVFETDAKFFTKGNILYFIVQATFTDDQLSVSSLPSSLTADDLAGWGVGEGQSYWYASFGNFKESYKETLEDERYGVGVDKILAKAGISDSTYWVGVSDDLAVWDGKFYNLDVSSIAPKDFIAYFNLFYRKYDAANPSDWDYFNVSTLFSDDDREVAEAQSILSRYTEVATKRGVAGVILSGEPDEDGEYSSTLEPLAADSPYSVVFKIEPNAWIGFLRGGDLIEAPQVVYMKSITAEIKADGEARLTVVPITLEEYVDELNSIFDSEIDSDTVGASE